MYNVFRMFYIVGLGNPGEQYHNTRHNVGFFMVQKFIAAHALPEPVESQQYAGEVSQGMVASQEVSLLLPNTFMNHSGSAVKKLVPKGQEEQLVLIYDDIDLALGDMKVSFGRSGGGHNGVDSVIASLDTRDFIRIRIGIAKKHFLTGRVVRPKGGAALNAHVLGAFTSKEMEQISVVSDRVVEAIDMILSKGKEAAMNTFNA